jgi:hypothetical protein
MKDSNTVLVVVLILSLILVALGGILYKNFYMNTPQPVAPAISLPEMPLVEESTVSIITVPESTDEENIKTINDIINNLDILTVDEQLEEIPDSELIVE